MFINGIGKQEKAHGLIGHFEVKRGIRAILHRVVCLVGAYYDRRLLVHFQQQQ